ncbi:MAG: class I SAM-dependent methyltransferase, partial [Pyrinomonadaceae bacterium]
MTTIRNIYACLVHERQECVVDLVRNLRYLDPDSHILLYNGGGDAALLDGGFPWETYRAVVHPQPRPMAWGRLHDFALDCMRFALAELPFDTLTVVASDQLALRAGYAARLARFLADKRGVGMLGNSPGPQTWNTHIAPAKSALREVGLWRPFLRRFEGGEAKFVHWSFWPSTVFTADAARALTTLFDSDAALQDIMRQTKIRATEEVILPTLVALLGFDVLANPCSDDYLKFRVRFTPRQLDAALAREDVFWVHPVARNNGDGLRRHIRARLNQYEKPFEGGALIPTNDAGRPDGHGTELPLALPNLARMKTVEGWLRDDEADLLIAVTSRALKDLPAPHRVVEVGSYCGRSTVVFGSVVKALRPDAKVYAIDPHDGRVGATGQRSTKTAPTLEKFQWNIRNAGLTETVELIQKYSHEVEWGDPISLLFIDGLHDYANVARDFFHFERFVVEGGYVAFHDYADYCPGVKTFVNEVLGSGRYRKVHCAMSMMVVQKLAAAESSGDAGDRQQQPRAAQPEAEPNVEANVTEPPIAAQPSLAPAAAQRAAAAEQHAAVQLTNATAHATPAQRVPRGAGFDRLSAFRGVHEGASFVVCGCGESLNQLERPEEFLTVGVNDVGRRFQPNYLVVVNPRNQFTGDRFKYVEGSRAEYVFTQLELGLKRDGVVKFRLGSYGGTNISKPDALDYAQNSPYVALCLAAHMGARRVGLIGVDFTDHHFFARTGRHPLAPRLATIDAQYRRLGEALGARGIGVFNLSAASRLTAFPKLSVEEFAALSETEATRASSEAGSVSAETFLSERDEPLRVVSYATTPVAGVPEILARCVAARTPHAARCVWARGDYGNGVRFEGGLEWTTERARAEEELSRADLVVVHNGKFEPRHRPLLARKAVITMAHNYMWNVEGAFVRRGFPGVVVGQYQAALPEFDGWEAVPNPIPLWEPEHQPGAKGETITICYTPSGRHERYPEGHKLYWHSKGYATTMRVLDRLAARYPLRLEVINGRQVSHAESLAMKRRSHICIDECVTGSYHRNSLEGLAAGCVVVNGLGLRPEIEEVFRRCAPGSVSTPFVRAGLEGLEGVLASLVELGAGALAEAGAANRRWMEEHWDFKRQWEHFWAPVVARALGRAGRAPAIQRARNGVGHAPAPHVAFDAAHEAARVATRAPTQPASSAPANAATVSTSRATTTRAPLRLVERRAPQAASGEGVSVVVPHGGVERLAHLEKTLTRLREVGHVLDVAVVEMDERPHALGVARRLADAYAFVRREGVFHKARVLNAGVPLAARSPVVLWLDNDLLLPEDFLPKALAEMHRRRLDCLVPWTSVRYLSRDETAEVFAARRTGVGDCAHVNAYYTRQGACGGAVLVRREFLRRAGGMCEGFRGWGGEDNAWFYRARVLGSAAVTQRPDQHLYHLHHENSGGYDSTNHLAKNPHYDANVALLRATRRVTSRAEMLARFPAPRHFTCPWDASRRVRVAFAEGDTGAREAAGSTADALRALYGFEVERISCDDGLTSDGAAEALRACDAAVVFGEGLALRLLGDERLEGAWTRLLVSHVGARDAAFDGEALGLLSRAGAHFSFGAGAARALEAAGLDCWRPPGGGEACGDASDAALGLAQPLSLVVAGAAVAASFEA